MTIQSKFVSAVVLVGLMIYPTAADAQDSNQSRVLVQTEVQKIFKTQDKSSTKSYVRVLSDHPGSATALTPRQKSEIEAILAKAKNNQHFICTAASLSGQRESMYRVVLLRAQLVCDYAKTINPALKTVVQEKTTSARKFNGRVVVVSK